MKKLIITTAAIFSMLAFFSCKKSDKIFPANMPDVLLNKNWKLTSFKAKINNGVEMDVLSFWDDCEKDDLYIFKPEGHLTLDEGASKCDLGSAQMSSGGTWTYNNNSKMLSYNTINSMGDHYEWTITDANETSFTGTGAENFGTDHYDYKVTFSRQ